MWSDPRGVGAAGAAANDFRTDTNDSRTARRRVLCVDDSAIDAELVYRLMRRLDAEVIVDRAGDGDEALVHLAAAETAGTLPELVLLDLNMPRMDGHECLARIRERRAWDAVTVVILTTSMRASDRERAALGGAAEYLVKPPERDALARLLDAVRQAYVDPARVA